MKDIINQFRCFLLLFIGTLAVICIAPIRSIAQPAENTVSINTTTETLLSDSDWKLGSYPIDKGELEEVYLSGFDDRGFRTVKVPGEVPLQIGLKGMDLYYQSKQLTLVNEKEWWYRKRFVVPKADAGKIAALGI